MELNNRSYCGFLFLLLAALSFCSSASTSTFISDNIFGDRASIGRNLLQAKKACPVNFEFLNYTVIVSQCKGPQYPPKLCCGAFKEFACPYADELNDASNDCASIMFSYINLHGKYPPGLFANQCRDGKNGLDCPATPPAEAAADASKGSRMEAESAHVSKGSRVLYNPSLLLVLSTGFLVLLWQSF